MRPVLVSVETDQHGDAVSADVVLTIANQTVSGHAMRASSDPQLAIAAATFRALGDATRVTMRAVAAETTTVASVEVAIVLVEVPALSATLAGCVVVTDRDDPGIYAKAALDAINRIVCSPHLLRELASRSAYVA
jgi:hypothetical protein